MECRIAYPSEQASTTEPVLGARHGPEEGEGRARWSPRAGLSSREASLKSVLYRGGIVGVGLAASGCVIKEADANRQFWQAVLIGSLLVVAAMVFLLSTGLIVFLSVRRRQRRLAKIVVALVAGSVCGALWILLVDTAFNEGIGRPSVFVVGVVTALAVAGVLLRPNSMNEVLGRSVMAIGFHSLALPIAALVSFVLGGAQWFPAASVRPALGAVVLGIRLAGDLRTVGLSIGGLLLGLLLVFVGDRMFRRGRVRRARSRFDLRGPRT